LHGGSVDGDFFRRGRWRHIKFTIRPFFVEIQLLIVKARGNL
jgi:hypothetical protein